MQIGETQYILFIYHDFYLFIIIPDEAIMAKRWILNNN